MNPSARVLSIVPDKTVELAADETGVPASARPMLKFEHVGFEYDGRAISSASCRESLVADAIAA